jgi:ATP-dependent Lhr-like helicase
MMTNLQASNSESSSGFARLDERIQRWIWTEGWTALRDAQERAIPALIDADRDVIVAAATAAGKTEAAFFPILTHLLQQASNTGLVVYISPLKALINDQWGRLTGLCESLDIPVIGWHGDIAASKKHRFLKSPQGVLLITPESLEALFVTRGTSMAGLMANLRYVVIDELHAFIGSERGKQLQSLLHRLERVAGHHVPRVGLSATLGDMRLAAHFLRSTGPEKVELIESKSSGLELKVLVKGYGVKPPRIELEPDLAHPEPEDLVSGSFLDVAAHLYKVLRGTNNLVFPNSRQKVETFTDLLRRKCERDCVPNEFWAHHGSLSKEYREEAEQALKEGSRPATAICTTTLELGIDIGSVKSICQVGSPPSVASLRQRLGRSGRRKGESAVLRGYCIEPQLEQSSSTSDCLREELVQSIAMIRLLIAGWFEPPRVSGLHGSTLIQQILSIIAERGGATAAQLWSALVASDGPFAGVSKDDFVALLRHLGALRVLTQESSGLLLHGEVGEQLVNHYTFYAAFATEEEFRLVCDGKALGTLPISRPLLPQQGVIFAGRRWRVIDVDTEKKLIVVSPDKGGAPPMFESGHSMVHDRIRQEMRKVLAETDAVAFLDHEAQQLLQEGREHYRRAGLKTTQITQRGAEVELLTWRGDWVNDALALLLTQRGLASNNDGLVISVSGGSKDKVIEVLRGISQLEDLDPVTLLAEAKNTLREKWDWAMPDEMARRSFASLCIDLEGARDTARALYMQER